MLSGELKDYRRLYELEKLSKTRRRKNKTDIQVFVLNLRL